MNAIIVTGGTADEIAALAVGLQERQEADELGPGGPFNVLPEYVPVFKDGTVKIEKRG